MEPFIGQIIMFAGNFAPRGWALCNGQLLPISSNSALFSILGTTYGGDGRTTFALPDLRGRAPIHAGTGPGLSPRSLGQRAGTETNVLNTTQLPSHSHASVLTVGEEGFVTPSASAAGHWLGNAAAGTPYRTASGTGSIQGLAIGNTGNNQPVNNLSPFLTVNYIVALQGTFPSRS